MSLHTWHLQGPRKPSSYATFMLNSYGAELPQTKKVLHLCAQGCFGHVQLFATLWTVACQASVSERGFLHARILELIGQHWLPYPSKALYFLLPWLPTPLST